MKKIFFSRNIMLLLIILPGSSKIVLAQLTVTANAHLVSSGSNTQIVLQNMSFVNNGTINHTTGAFNMMPLCYGRINANGNIYTATPNVSVTRTSAGTYEINCSGITDGSIMTVTVYGSTRYIGTASYVSSGKMLVQIENISEVIDDPDGFHSNEDKTLYFIVYNQ